MFLKMIHGFLLSLILLMITPGISLGVHELGVGFGETYKGEKYAESLDQLGVSNIHINVWWGDVEPVKGQYDYSKIDSFLTNLPINTTALMRISARKNTWGTKFGNVPVELGVDGDFYKFVYNVVCRTQGRVAFFENEWEADCTKKHWEGTAEEYAEMSIIFCQAVKAANPNAKVILGVANGTLGLCKSFTVDVLDYLAVNQPQSFDYFDIHLYNVNTSQLYDIPERILYFRELLDSYAVFSGKPIVTTEYGGPTPNEFAYVDMQKFADLTTEIETDILILANDLSSTPLHPEGYPDQFRMFAYGLEKEPWLDVKRDRIMGKQLVQRTMLALSGGVEKVYWWRLADSYLSGKNLDFVKHPVFGKLSLTSAQQDGLLSPNPTFYSYQKMSEYLNNAKSVTRLPENNPDVYLFQVVRSDDTICYVLWERRDQYDGEGNQSVSHIVATTWSSVSVSDVFGNMREEKAVDGKIDLALTDVPLFLTEFTPDIKPPAMFCLF